MSCIATYLKTASSHNNYIPGTGVVSSLVGRVKVVGIGDMEGATVDAIHANIE